MALVGHVVRETMVRIPAHVNRDDLTSAGLDRPRAGGAGLRRRARRPLRPVRRHPDPRRHPRRAAQHRLGLALGPPPRPRPRRDPHRLAGAPRPGPERRRGGQRPRPHRRGGRGQRRRHRPRPGPLPRRLAGQPVRRDPGQHLAEPRSRWSSTASELTYMVEAVAELPERLRVVVQEYFLGRAADGRDRRDSSASPSPASPRCAPRRSSCSRTRSTPSSSPSWSPHRRAPTAAPPAVARPTSPPWPPATPPAPARSSPHVRRLPGHRLTSRRGSASIATASEHASQQKKQSKKDSRTFLNPARPGPISTSTESKDGLQHVT